MLVQQRSGAVNTAPPNRKETMSTDPNDTPRMITVPIPRISEGFISTLDHLSNVSQVRAYYRSHSGFVAVSIGGSQVALPADVWEAVVDAVRQVLPKPAAELANYTACEGSDAEDGAA